MEGGDIGKPLIMEFANNESAAFAEIMNVLQKYPDFCRYTLKGEVILSLPDLEIRPERRKICSNSHEITMTKKEFDIFYLLAVNKGRVLTYEQIYQSVWNGYATGGERTAVVYHIRNIRKKLSNIPTLSIQCVRELGYCMEVETEELQ
ncbi:winged helix-turn-helix domain-containing protein [Petralouisia muris]|nr:winged helix-turn-helix domain-containing protein [Petralouisia muris]